MKFFSIISFTVLAATLFLASGVEPAARRAANARRPAADPNQLPWTATDLQNGGASLGAAFEGSRSTMDSINILEKDREAKKQSHLQSVFFEQDVIQRANTAGHKDPHGADRDYILSMEAREAAEVKQAAGYNKLLHKTQMLQKAAADAARKNNPKAAAAALEQARIAAQKLAANSKTDDQKKKTKGVLGKLRSAWRSVMRRMRKIGNKVTFGWIKYDKSKYAKKKPVADVAPAAGAPAAAVAAPVVAAAAAAAFAAPAPAV